MKNKSNCNRMALAAVLLLATAITACRKESVKTVPIPVDSEVTIQLKDGYWTYYNIKNSEEVGFGLIGDSIDDSEWFLRSDWDVAFSVTGIRTNSGTSGKAGGGIRIMPQVPDSLNLSQYEEYRYQFNDFLEDTLGIYTEIPLN